MKINVSNTEKTHVTTNTQTRKSYWHEEKGGELREVFRDGRLIIDDTLQNIRQRIRNIA